MDNKNLSFEEIVSSISDNEMMAPYQYKSNSELREDNLHLISPEKQRFYLAFYAKAAYEHVGFEGFTPENQEKFKAQIEQIYASISSDRLQGEFLNELAEKTAKYIEDRHFEIGVGNKTFHGGEKKEPSNVGSNFFFNKDKPAGYQSLGQGWSDEFGERFPTWEIGTLKQGNEDILVVSIPNLGFKNDYESWKDFIETFDNVYLPNKEKWDKGRIILDVRGNKGGEDKPIDHVAKRLYGNMLNTYKRCEIKDTELSNYFLHQHGAYKPQNYERSGLTAQNLVVRSNFSGENKTLFDETGTYYPFNEEAGYNGKIDILIDRDVGSSAESAYTSFYHHKNVRYIGENTAGMQQYTQGTFPTPWGGGMRVAVTKLTYWDKDGENIEVKGHRPDINCSGHDAFDVALTIGIDEGRVIGFREKNEKESENQVYAEYDPRAATDPRKAYYAKYLDPAIREIEKQNIKSKISITEPSIEHYEAFIKACKKMKSYIDDPKTPNDVAKQESKGFIFARFDPEKMTREKFEEEIVNGYKEKAKDSAEKPEYFRFIMVGDTIVGSVNVRGLKRDDFDKENGLSTFEKWEGKRVTTSSVILSEYRGLGIVGEAKKLFFDEIRALGINEVTGTVLSNNARSNRAQEKMMEEYGGRMYQVSGDSDGTGIKYYNRYVISTDTSGKSKGLYKKQESKQEKNCKYLESVRKKLYEHKQLSPISSDMLQTITPTPQENDFNNNTKNIPNEYIVNQRKNQK